MIAEEVFTKRSFASKRGYVLVARRPELRGLEPVGVIASRIPKYLDSSGKGEERFTSLLGVAFGIAEVALGLFAIVCLIGLVAAGLFFRGAR